MLVRLLSLLRQDPSVKHSVMYFYPGPNEERLRELGIDLYHIKGFVSPYDIVAFGRVCAVIKRIKPDLISTSLWSANILGRMLSVLFRIPLVNSFHSDVRDHGRLRNFLEKATITIPDKLICVSSSVQHALDRSIISKLSPINRKHVRQKLTVIHNGIDDSYANGPTKPDINKDQTTFTFGTVGRLVTIKQYDLLLASFALACQSVRNAHLLIVGDGPERAQLEALANKLGIKNLVTFAGHQDNVLPLYARMNCFVLSSKSEGLSVALLEAMSFGLPIITTHENMNHDVIVHGIHGLIVKPSDTKALAHAMIQLAHTPEDQKAMGFANKDLVTQQFSLKATSDQYKALYSAIMSIIQIE